MGQKTNLNIYQLRQTKDWSSKYFEKKIVEYSIYSKKDLEIRNFIYKFFKHQKININCCKLHYFNDALHIFLSYYQSLNWFLYIKNKNWKKNKKTQLKKKILMLAKKKIHIENFLYNWQIQLKKKQANNLIKKQTLVKYKKNVFIDNYKIKKNLRIKLFLKKNLESLKTKLIIENFFECLTKFTSKNFKIFLTLQRLNENIKFTENIKKVITKNLIKLRKYKENLFFYHGIKIIFTVVTNQKSSNLFAQFIAAQLKFLKLHNFFFKFIKDVLSLFKSKIFSKIKGIKIKIKGRLNGRPRTRSRVIKIANSSPALSISSLINYSEAAACTLNGTFGVKIWIFYL